MTGPKTLEGELAQAREQLAEVTPGPEGGSWGDYRVARAKCVRLERELALSRGEEAAIKIPWELPWDTGAPSPHVLTSGRRTLLFYYIAEPDPDWTAPP